MSNEFDVLLLGATGFTGQLIAEYLSKHQDRTSFKLGLAGRSTSKLKELANRLGFDASVGIVQVDVTNPDHVAAAVRRTSVVINVVGPFHKWGTPVVHACALYGKHYVDLTGESPWIRKIILDYDFLASKSGAAIIPCSGFDSIPADLAVYLANKTLKSLSPPRDVGETVSSYKIKGGLSGGTIASGIGIIEDVPVDERRAAFRDYSFSPTLRGARSSAPRLLYHLPLSPNNVGGFYPMMPVNRGVVQRTWSLHQLNAHVNPSLAYGPKMRYEEFIRFPNALIASVWSLGVAIGGLCMLFAPFRWFAKRILPGSGSGPSPQVQKTGYLELINITSSAPSSGSERPVHVRTTIRGTGDPGYSLTAVMISEAALALALDHGSLPAIGKQGGVLTPMSALGDVLVESLRRSGRFEISSEVLREEEARKTR